MDTAKADDIHGQTSTESAARSIVHDEASSTNPIFDSLPDEIIVPRTRPPMPKTSISAATSSIQQGHQSSSSSARPPNRRCPSKGPRRSIDGRPLIRSTKISVRMKPRSTAATLSANVQTPAVGPATPILSHSPSNKVGASTSPRKTSSSARKASSSSPRKPSINRQTCDNELANGGRLGSLRAAGGLRPRYSVSYRLGRPPRAAAEPSNLDSLSPASVTTSRAPTPAAVQPEVTPPIITDTVKAEVEAEKTTGETTSAPQDGPPLPPPDSQISDAQKLAEAWRNIQRQERQLKEREDALRLGQKRLRQDREAFEREKRQFHEEQQQHQHNHQRRAFREEEIRKRRTAKRSRSRSRPRSKVIQDDSWRRDHRNSSSNNEPEQQERHTSWSSINSTTSPSPSPCPSSDTESATTATTATTHSTKSSCSSWTKHPARKPPPLTTTAPCTWTSPPSSLAAAYARYNTQWTRLHPRSPHVPYPSPNHTPAELRKASHLPLSAQDGWAPDAVVKYNAIRFFLVAHGVPVAPDVGAARPKVGFGSVGGEEGLRALVREARRELRRWHEDGLKYRSGVEEEEGGEGLGGERRVNEELVRDETARAVFRAFTELRDGLLAEIRWRKENGGAAAAATTTEAETGREDVKGKGNADNERNGGGRQTDWTVLSEAIL